MNKDELRPCRTWDRNERKYGELAMWITLYSQTESRSRKLKNPIGSNF